MRKTLAVAGTFLATLLLAVPALAQDEVTAESVQANLDATYFMLAIVLVFLMQAGFAMLETGLTRSKNSANIMMKNMADASFGIVAYFIVGFALMYGASQAGLIGGDGFFLGPGEYNGEQGLAGNPELAHDFMYQAVFAATAATIVSGAVAGRMKFSGYILVSILMTTLIYPMVGHWKWGGGWLNELGFYDFAGSTVVHLTGGVAALVVAGILGPRIGKYGADRKPRAMPGHSAPLAVLGTFVLWFGWFGFNGGSVLAADSSLLGPVLLTTGLAGAAGGAAAIVYTWIVEKKPDYGMTCNGILAGLVGITAGADVVGPIAAIGVGLVAGVLVAVAVPVVDRMGIDDAVGAFSVHGVCGVLGTWWVGAYANNPDGDVVGFWHGGGLGLFGDQVLGTVAVTAFVTVAAAIVAFALKAAGLLRVSEEEEIEGLDIHEHGMYGYPELALGSSSTPGASTRGDGRGAPGYSGSREVTL